jgi:hypothetical protein
MRSPATIGTASGSDTLPYRPTIGTARAPADLHEPLRAIELRAQTAEREIDAAGLLARHVAVPRAGHDDAWWHYLCRRTYEGGDPVRGNQERGVAEARCRKRQRGAILEAREIRSRGARHEAERAP